MVTGLPQPNIRHTNDQHSARGQGESRFFTPQRHRAANNLHMKTQIKLLLLLLGFCVCSKASAQFLDRFKFEPDQAIYGPHEFSIDALGAFASRDKNGSDNSAWGYGVGVNYFFSEYYGIGADSYADAFNWPYDLNVTGIMRYPIGKSGWAPYGYAGFGRQWAHAAQWFGDLGGGIEFRFSQRTGTFTDLRGMFPAETDSYLLWRFGFRFAF